MIQNACRLLAATLAAFVLPIVAHAQTPEQFYQGHEVTLVVPTLPGGINDLSANLVARHLGQFIPGQPKIVLTHEPKGGGLALLNAFATTAPRDGSVIAVVQRAVPQLAFEGDPKAKFDPLAFTWLGSLSSFADDAYMIVVNTDFPARTAEDLKHLKTPARIGADGVGSTNYTIGVVAKETLGLKLAMMPDFTGAPAIFKAMQDGRLDGQVIGLDSISANQPAIWQGKKVRPLIQFGRVSRHPELPDVPTGRELTNMPQAQEIIAFAELPFQMALPFLAPPGLPADRARALQEAFAHMMADPDFRADAKRVKLGISPVTGTAVAALLASAAATPKDVIARYVRMTRVKK